MQKIKIDVFHKGNFILTFLEKKNNIRIGKLKSSDISLDGEEIARMHAVIEINETEGIKLIDLGSPYGTIINGHRIDKTIKLKNKDVLTFGQYELKVTISDEIRDNNQVENNITNRAQQAQHEQNIHVDPQNSQADDTTYEFIMNLFFYRIKENWDAIENVLNAWERDHRFVPDENSQDWKTLETTIKTLLIPIRINANQFWNYIYKLLQINDTIRALKLVKTARSDYEHRLWLIIAMWPFRVIYKLMNA